MRILLFFAAGIILAIVSFFLGWKGTLLCFFGSFLLLELSAMMPTYVLARYFRIVPVDITLSFVLWAVPSIVCVVNFFRKLLKIPEESTESVF